MGARQILPLMLVFAVLVFSGHGQSRAGGTNLHKQSVAGHSLPAVPTGSDRCKVCHVSEVEGYARSAMSHSLRRATQEPSGAVSAGGTKITAYTTPAGSWQRWQSGNATSIYPIDYVIGSGNHAAGYLVDISGHLFQSPIAFYKSRNAYDLAPGYEKVQDPDFTRPVAEGCVFCHAGRELHVAGTDNQYRAPVFPDEAITCERCHGPSERHLADPRAETIVNPAKLEPGARDSICEQCHLMGAARVPNPGREFLDFQPGQRLETTFTTYHDALAPNTPAAEFKVISHVEQLALSVCARSSAGKLWCGTCHNPHDKPVQPVAYYRSRCLSCHTKTFPSSHPDTGSNCIGCHMPRRDAQDGGHTAFTDHRIQRRPQAQVDSLLPANIAAWREPAPELQKRNLGIASINAGLQRRSADLMVRGYVLLTEVQAQFASDPEVFMWMGTALLVGGKPSEAKFAFERVEQLNPNSAAAETNMAAALQQAGDIAGAVAHWKRALAIDPMHFSAISALLHFYDQQGDATSANELSEHIRKMIETAGERKIVAPTQPAQTAGANRLAAATFKNIKVLKDVPSDQLIPSMRFIAASLGVECSYCHVEGHFDDDAKRPKQIARNMMQMMLAINRNNFDGAREVTCFSCHRGTPKPEGVPPVVSVASDSSTHASATAPDSKMESGPELLPTARELLDRYIQVLGGVAAIENIKTRVETGSAESRGRSYPVEIYVEAPGKRAVIEKNPAGKNVTILNGDSGLVEAHGRGPRKLHGGELDAERIAADLQFPLHFSQEFPDLRLEYSQTVRGRRCYVLMARRKNGSPWKFFFDAESGLLVRLVEFDDSPLGLDPTQVDYGDYREVDGTKVPFQWTTIGADGRTTMRIKEVKQNIPIDDAKFSIQVVTASKSP